MKRKGVTIVECLVTMVVIALLFAILFPVFAIEHQRSRHSCTSNMRQIGLCVAQYAQDYDDVFPYSGRGHDWPDEPLIYFPQLLLPYNKVPALFRCPGDVLTDQGALYDALASADRAPALPHMPVSYYYFYDFYHADIGTSRTPSCTPGSLRPARQAEVLYPADKALLVCILSDQYVSPKLSHESGSPRHPYDSLLFADCHFKFVPIASLADIACFPEHNLDWSGVGAKDVK